MLKIVVEEGNPTLCWVSLRSTQPTSEANGAISQADFSSKISIAYKECLETKYWLSLLKDTGYIKQKAFDSIYNDADEIGKILFSILKKTKMNQK